ncbi:dihydrolipoyllysine-residue acetyltransferase [Tamilnaduibacter salinus]|uniref:Acetyltransferase component of pyruvate dehydrogenase complex n=1 Tax=Tamilnaduibacter salinus TaxID=1484056 RepID=A0A2A2I467_9GAMM|nr:dihydrolipoyllysine-residue acetyltransferase [Tamilnaduibacter salinus]PAV26519.1 dihydrolipoyllysine-residue acetyltransferase [Tamilnaduibacter salinus]
MSTQDIKVPDLGGADEVEIIEITVSEGDQVEEEDPILTVESDKASVELPAPASGTIQSLTVKVGDKLKEGDVVGTMEAGESGGADDRASEDKDEASDTVSSDSESDEPKESATPAPSGGTRQETVKVPNLDGFDNVPVIEINVSVGDEVEEEDALVSVESDKATMEIPSSHAGRIEEVLVNEGDKISEGDDLVRMTITEEGGEEAAAAEGPAKSSGKEEAPAEPGQDKAPSEPQPAAEPASSEPVTKPGAAVHAGPAVRKLAREFGADLTRIKGSGPKGRVLKDDVQSYVKGQLKQTQEGGAAASAGGIPGIKLPDFSQFGEVQRESMTRMQVATAENMHRSWLNVPHVTQHDDADITDLEAFRKSQKAAGEKRGVKMTPMPFLLKAAAQALAELPQFNVSLDMERREIVRKQYIHIGIAVDTPSGLMVPVIRDVDKKGLWELAEEAGDLAAKARDKKLKPDEMKGACFSITSLGGIGGTAFTPIVNPPEVAILGVSKAAMKPVWDGDAFQPRLMMPLSLSYDHRAVNGADAARFTSLMGELLGDIRRLLL